MQKKGRFHRPMLSTPASVERVEQTEPEPELWTYFCKFSCSSLIEVLRAVKDINIYKTKFEVFFKNLEIIKKIQPN